ncbi:MAG: VWA domain-containing protein [Legionellales bacterium]|nr:VWA domain-containing protein [Legionellales bacterium]
MKANKLLGYGLAWVVMLITIASNANSSNEKITPAKLHDMRVLIDVSGSMKKNDPDNLRIPAAKLLINLIPNNNKIGFWTFANDTGNLISSATVDRQWKDKQLSKPKLIHSNGSLTDIAKALDTVTVDWQKKPDSQYHRSLLLLTDGFVDIGKDENKNKASREYILNELLPKLKKSQIKIYSIALSDNADKDLLKRLSNDTGGKYIAIQSNQELEKTFFEMFQADVQPPSVKIDGRTFKIDASVKELTILSFNNKPDFTIQTPSGEKYQHTQHPKDVRWFHEKNYDLVTIPAPEVGEWTLQGAGDDKHAMILSDLHLNTNILPYNVFVNETIPMKVALLNKDKIITEKKFLENVEFIVSEVGPDQQEKIWRLEDFTKTSEKKVETAPATDQVVQIPLTDSDQPKQDEKSKENEKPQEETKSTADPAPTTEQSSKTSSEADSEKKSATTQSNDVKVEEKKSEESNTPTDNNNTDKPAENKSSTDEKNAETVTQEPTPPPAEPEEERSPEEIPYGEKIPAPKPIKAPEPAKVMKPEHQEKPQPVAEDNKPAASPSSAEETEENQPPEENAAIREHLIKFADKPGNYVVTVTASGKTFSRVAKQTVTVYESPVKFDYIKSDDPKTPSKIVFKPNTDLVIDNAMRYSVRLVESNKEPRNQVLLASTPNHTININTNMPGVHKIVIDMEGSMRNGRPFKVTSREIEVGDGNIPKPETKPQASADEKISKDEIKTADSPKEEIKNEDSKKAETKSEEPPKEEDQKTKSSGLKPILIASGSGLGIVLTALALYFLAKKRRAKKIEAMKEML